MNSKRPRILMFAPLCYPPAGSEAIVTSKLVLAMIEAGWIIKVISQSDFGHYYPTSENEHWKPLLSVIKNIPGINEKGIIARLMIWPALKNRIRTILWVVKAVFAGLIASKREKFDFVLSRVAPQYGHLPALIVSRITGIPWIANWSDPMPPSKALPPYGNGPDASIPFYLTWYYMAILKTAAWHTFACERLRRYFCRFFPQISERSSVIPHIALERFRSNLEFRDGKNGFSLCHAGSLTFRATRIFLEGVKMFVQQTRVEGSFTVKFVGQSGTSLAETVKELGIQNIIVFEDAKSYEDTQAILAKATVLVVIEASCEEGIYFPSKFVDLVQTGRPIIAVSPIPGTLHDILSSYGGGIAIGCRSPNAVADALDIFYKEWRQGTIGDNFGSAKLYDLFSEQHVLGLYNELFSHLNSGQSIL